MFDLKLRKKYNIEKNVKFMDQYIGFWHLILEVLLCVVFLWYVTVNLFDKETTMALLFAFIALLFTLRGLFEFILKREKRRHIISFMYVGLCAALFKVRGRELLQTSEKYYLVDVGLRRIMLPDANADQGHILENVIYLELVRRGYTVYVGRVDGYEIDFVAVDTLQNLTYYQVALETLNEETLTRELRPLQKVSDSYPKYLLTLDTIGTEANYNGIVKMNALDWLLSDYK